ncbi:DNA polymerase III subunit gamma/tau [Patescibacteria group bacterium]|nr:DNA polymerase III subunit gamma/tau [Patescibacteria group bacterium]MBU1907470.1 DNA polymerase III subunit gamma/tau [Patescibacteria group bacterium]
MSETLYRKYRPASFKDVVGQDHITTTLKNQLGSDSVAHAYLFTGPRGVGKTTLARLLAKAVNCEKLKDNEPCNKCDACREIVAGNSLDVYEIDAASNTGVDNVRENIIESVRFVPNSRKFKVYVIDEVHMLSTSAFNALLKTLEEPPAHALFILATTEIHKVPETIISRCQRFDFKRIRTDELVKRLKSLVKQEGVEVDDEVLAEIARRSEGCLRDAESLLGQILALGDKKIGRDEASLVLPSTGIALVIDFVDAIGKGNTAGAIRMINEFVEEGVQLDNFTDEVVSTLRSMLFAKLGGLEQFEKDFDKDTSKRLETVVENYSSERLLVSINVLLDARRSLAREKIPQLPLELAVVELCQDNDPKDTKDSKDPEEAREKNRPKVESKGENLEVDQERRGTKFCAPTAGDSVSLDTIKSKWNDVFNKIAEKNASLPLVLQSAEILGLNDGRLQIGFQFEFHAEMINQTKNRLLIEEAATNIFGSQILIEGVHRASEKDEVVADLVSEFGGKVVG